MSLKVLFLPIDYNDFKQDGFARSFEYNDCEICYFDYFGFWDKCKSVQSTRLKLLEIANAFKPDVFFIQTHHLSIIDSDIVKKIKYFFPKCIFCNWTQDIKNYVLPSFLEMSKICDYNLACSTGQIKFLSEGTGKPVYYLNTGYDEKLYFPESEPRSSFDSDVVFTGNHNNTENFPGTKERTEVVILLNKTFGDRFKLYGTWPEHINSRGHYNQRQINDVYQKSICNLSISHYNDISDYFSDRLLRVLASGRPTISFRFPGWQNYFTDMSDLVIVNSVEEIPERVNMLKNNPELASFIGRNGAAKVLAEHSYITRVRQLFNIIGVSP